MRAAIKKLWVKALKYGKYKKCKGKLHRKHGFCCLGVLTDLYIKIMKPSTNWSCGTGGFFYFNQEENTLPAEVRDWAGLGKDNPGISFNGEGIELTTCNDGRTKESCDAAEKPIKPMPFKKIAGLIQKQL